MNTAAMQGELDFVARSVRGGGHDGAGVADPAEAAGLHGRRDDAEVGDDEEESTAIMQRKKPDDGDGVTFTRGSVNVFADLGLDDADELLVKADLAHAINNAIRERGWTQCKAAEHTGLTLSDVSRMGRMKADGFSQDRLQSALRAAMS